MKSKAFFITAIVFGAIAVLLLIISAIIFLTKDTSFCNNLGQLLGMGKNSISTSDIAEIAVVCTLPSFLFGYKSFSDSEKE